MLDDQSVSSRKQSASDLQSRLKTRKLLGVGELAGDNGEIYRSKVSQLLGINESLYVRLPRGLLYWNTANTLFFYLFGAMLIVFPSTCVHFELGITPQSSEALIVARMYGVVLISYGLLFKSTSTSCRSVVLQRETRSEMATLLLISAFMYALHFFVLCFFTNVPTLSIFIKLSGVLGNLVYHAYVDTQGGIHRHLFRLLNEHCYLASPITERKYDPNANTVASATATSHPKEE